MQAIHKSVEDMTLKEIREYVSPNLAEDLRDTDHRMMLDAIASVFAYRQETPTKAEDLKNIGEKLESLKDAVEFVDDFLQNIEAITEGIREMEHETFGQAAKELTDYIKDSDLYDWRETHCTD